MIFMQEQVHTMAYALQVNRFQTTVTSISSVAIMISEACLGSWGPGTDCSTLLEVARDPGTVLVVSSPASVDGSGTGIAGVGGLSKRSYSPSWAEF